MITIQAYRGLGASSRSSADIARAAFYPAGCKVERIYQYAGEHVMPNGIKRSFVTNGCSSLPANAYPQAMKGAGEQDFIYMFRDGQTVYTVNYAVRGAPLASKVTLQGMESFDAVLRSILGEVMH